MAIIHHPTIYIVGRQQVDEAAIQQFLTDQETSWETDTEVGAEQLCEVAGRTCYMSFGSKQGRKTNGDYLHNIIEMQHGSVLEHASWNFLITGVSRSFTHELIRHRAGFGFSQLSQRYVDESTADYVEPEIIADAPELHEVWLRTVQAAQEGYNELVDRLSAHIEATQPGLPRTHRRKMARQAARSVLPNATETKIFVTANARALRHFFELRGSDGAETEIRAVAVAMLALMQEEAPNIFGDFEVYTAADGLAAIRTPYHKV